MKEKFIGTPKRLRTLTLQNYLQPITTNQSVSTCDWFKLLQLKRNQTGCLADCRTYMRKLEVRSSGRLFGVPVKLPKTAANHSKKFSYQLYQATFLCKLNRANFKIFTTRWPQKTGRLG